MKKILRASVSILTFLVFVFGTIATIQVCNKIVSTSLELLVLSDNAMYYNDNPRKTDTMTEKYLENNKKRQEIYNSKDDVVRNFSNQHTLVKLVILLVAIAIYPLMFLVWFKQICMIAYKSRKKIKAMRQRRKRSFQKLRKVTQ